MTKLIHLYDTLIPNNYKLELSLERLTRKFHGTVQISGQTNKLERTISLHSKDLEVTGATINSIPASVSYHEDDVCKLSLDSELTSKEIVINLDFSGKINDHPHGLYPSYFEHNGEQKELLATQLEPHNAREIFPCVDEPSAKATFDVTVETETGIQVLGNMPIQDQAEVIANQESDKRLVTTFQTSPKMSTYLFALIVGELHSVSKKTKNGTDVNIWSAPTQDKKNLNFALQTAVKSIEFFEDYFDCPYPLPKADHVALPDMGGGASAAMENWGLITYREDCVVIDDNSGVSTKQRVAEVIVHETSHQWFGNLVTMQWWDDLWLNESFASLMEYVALDAIFPEWNAWQDFPTTETLPALKRDSNPGVQSIKTDVNHPDEINTLFDGAIVYAKGATVLRMVQVYLGNEQFRSGLKKYFQKHAYGNTVGSDLWDCLGEGVSEFITPWLEQSGFPVVTTSRDDAGKITLTQQQFLLDETNMSEKIWPIPLHSDDPSLPEVFGTKLINTDCDSKNLLINKGGNGQYIVNYDEISRREIIKDITNNKINSVDRLRVLLETTLLMRTRHLETASLIPLIGAFNQETSQPVWDIIGLAFGDLKRIVEGHDDAENKLKELARTVSQKLFDELGWDSKAGESESTTKLRGNVLSLALYGDNQDAPQRAQKEYQDNKNDISKINGELRALILAVNVRNFEDKSIIDHLLKVHNETSNSELQEDIAHGLTASKNTATIQRLLELLKDAKVIRPQNAIHWFIFLMRNRHGRSATWEWMKDNWQWVEDTYGSDKGYSIFPRVAGSILSTKAELEDYKEFFDPYLSEISLERTIRIGMSEIASRADWIDGDYKKTIEALSNL